MNQENTSVRLYHGELVVKRFTNFSKNMMMLPSTIAQRVANGTEKATRQFAGWPVGRSNKLIMMLNSIQLSSFVAVDIFDDHSFDLTCLHFRYKAPIVPSSIFLNGFSPAIIHFVVLKNPSRSYATLICFEVKIIG